MAEGAFDATGDGRAASTGSVARHAVEAESDDAAALNDLGVLLRDRFDDPARAAELFADAVSAGADDPVRTVEPTINLADFLLDERGDPAAARWWYERALRIDPTAARAHRGLAAACRALGEPTAASVHRLRAREIERGVAPEELGASPGVPSG